MRNMESPAKYCSDREPLRTMLLVVSSVTQIIIPPLA